MKILEITAFSSGICGVWTRVIAESSRLTNKHKVYVFSSNIKRGTGENDIAEPTETIDNVKIIRFPTKFSFGQNTYFWNFKKEALALKPDVIIAHAYRQYYSTQALKIAKKLNIPCYLVTHAPFLEKKLRNWKLNLAVFLYDNLIGKRILNQYAKVIRITNWETPYFLKLGVKQDQMVYIPNGVPEEFFKQKKSQEENKILFLGRIAPIKNLETLIEAMGLLKDKKLKLEIVGPSEPAYKVGLISKIKKLNLQDRITFTSPIYNLKEKIKKLDSAKIFVLPSKREAMPQVLIEAMSRGKITISSKTEGGQEIIKHKKNGFLFDIDNSQQLANILDEIQKMKKEELQTIKQNAYNSSSKFAWRKLIKKLESLIEHTS